jgi:hypothetical protein
MFYELAKLLPECKYDEQESKRQDKILKRLHRERTWNPVLFRVYEAIKNIKKPVDK